MLKTEVKTLYQRDFALWIEDTVKQLKDGNLNQVDLDNLIEEVETLGRSEKNAIYSHLVSLYSHALKRRYVLSINDYPVWEDTLIGEQGHLQKLLKNSPSLRGYLKTEMFDAWQLALRKTQKGYPNTLFPEDYPFPTDIDDLLNQEFWHP